MYSQETEFDVGLSDHCQMFSQAELLMDPKPLNERVLGMVATISPRKHPGRNQSFSSPLFESRPVGFAQGDSRHTHRPRSSWGKQVPPLGYGMTTEEPNMRETEDARHLSDSSRRWGNRSFPFIHMLLPVPLRVRR